MEHQQGVRQWARTVDLPDPIRWGDLEYQILEFPVSEEEVTEAEEAPGGPGRLNVALAYLLWVPYLLAPVIGLVLVIIALGIDYEPDRDDLIGVAQFFFVAGLILVAVQGMVWASTRDRSWMQIGTTVPVVVVSLVAYLLVRPLPGASWMALIALAAAVLGVVVLALLFFASKPTAPGPRVKWRTLSAEQKVQLGNRAMALEELKKRGLITDKGTDISGLVEMPVGSWHRMDERLRR
ncbi:hypothetical protein [Paramicrobacterium chengjingii]|uniref:Uncharacterized protein n=1 Tax=Paramicrobacterium chengjingii TaxID=2769067 RepID=A0ABX6YIW3_9MICO|nr:hypothetical protein [Microbacterium chengjingii]QPZ38697.1 hypothetical protein HCR76_00890 [Microbacterium chengjingii]